MNIYLKKKPEWYTSINPSGTVPCLQLDETRCMPESMIVAEYLDNAYPENKLIPSDPYTQACHKLIIEAFTKVIPYYYKLALKSDLNAGPDFNAALETFMVNLKEDYFGGIFRLNIYLICEKLKIFFFNLTGKKAAFVDFMIWPWIERFDFLQVHRNVVINTSIASKLENYMNRMKQIPVIKNQLNSPDNHNRFYETTVTKDVEQECDHGLA